jgi:hypothetical protein
MVKVISSLTSIGNIRGADPAPDEGLGEQQEQTVKCAPNDGRGVCTWGHHHMQAFIGVIV